MISRRRLLQASTASLGAASPLMSSWAGPARDPLTLEPAAAHALNRLGFGPRPGDIAAVARDPEGWIEQQLQPRTLALPDSLKAKLKESQIVDTDPIAALGHFNFLARENKLAGNAQPGREQTSPLGKYVRSYEVPAVESRLFRALESPRQLEEVMVDFWFNHFNVFQNKNFMRVLVGNYEHYAIRPFAMGRFRDLLGATAHHPAMLYYLDNWTSVGPQAEARDRGLNENYARELMELHTLGDDTGYSQQDVTQLARVFTGWTFAPPRPQRQAPRPAAAPAGAPRKSDDMPGFVFNERWHDQGEKLWMGHRIAPRGKAEGEFALDVLARHPATAQHIAFKLAQYFVSDQPDKALVTRLAAVFQAQDGQIVPVLRSLFQSDAFWSPSSVGSKFKTPYHYVLSSLRAGGYGVSSGLPIAATLAAQGMPLFGCQTPDGYKNTEAAWLNAEAMRKRLDFATQVANGRLGPERLSGGLEAGKLMDQLGPIVSPATRDLVAQKSGTPVLAVAMVLGSPGMMRR